AAPAFAQEAEREVEIIVDGEEVVVDGETIEEDVTVEDGRIIIRRVGPDGERRVERRFGEGRPFGQMRLRMEGDTSDVRVFRFGGPDGGLWREGPGVMGDLMGELADRLGSIEVETFDMGGPGAAFRLRGGLSGASGETRERIRSLEREARDLARAVRDGDESAEADLDRVLGDLFEARGEARREAAEQMRERARELMDRADELDASVDTREDDRDRLIDERKRALLGRPGSDW
ncbi:MAG: hypothetical protein AAFQ43_08805, partial [Bacteroidota bacterium]